MKLRCRLGYCFITPDVDIAQSSGGIWYPDTAIVQGKQVVVGQRKAKTGLVLLHHRTVAFDEELQGKRVIFDRWAGRPFKLKWTDGKVYEFITVSQHAVLAVIE